MSWCHGKERMTLAMLVQRQDYVAVMVCCGQKNTGLISDLVLMKSSMLTNKAPGQR
ncbi:hypothetical protein J2X14_001884 [Pantoea alhagi]|uniref:hypothetical protein n=1 Tax=Mixta sp. BE291 TaxID=3158787 RepID=UPI002857A618|nr:hypothetical protein [Pantoea alhagi]